MLDTIIRFSVLLAREMTGSEKVFGIYNFGIVIIFFNAMPGKKRFTNFVIGFYRMLGISMTLQNCCFLLSGSTTRGLSHLASNTIVSSSVVDTDLHHYIGDEGLSNSCHIMAIVPCDLKHVDDILAVLRLAFDFALICFKRKYG